MTPLTAHCACGQATITVDAAPTLHGICHCANCKRRTGSAFGISVYFDRGAVVGQGGQTQVYAFQHPAMNHDQQRHFCVRCGTTLFWFVSNLPQQIGIAGGCFAGADLGEPDYSANNDQREAWLGIPDAWKR